jgi:hypothetical protein
MRGSIPPLPNTPSWHGALLKKERKLLILEYTDTGNFYLRCVSPCEKNVPSKNKANLCILAKE